MTDRVRLSRENCGRQWRSRLSTKILVSADDELLGRVAEVLGAPQSAESFAVANGLTWLAEETDP